LRFAGKDDLGPVLAQGDLRRSRTRRELRRGGNLDHLEPVGGNGPQVDRRLAGSIASALAGALIMVLAARRRPVVANPDAVDL